MGDGSGMNSRNTQEIPNNVPPPSLKTETPQRQAYDDWLTNTFDEDTADALKEQSTTRKVPTESVTNSTPVKARKNMCIMSSVTFKIGSTVTTLYGLATITQIKRIIFGNTNTTTKTILLEELTSNEDGFLVVKPLDWSLANGQSPMLCLNLSTCKLLYTYPTTVKSVNVSEPTKNATQPPIFESKSKPIIPLSTIASTQVDLASMTQMGLQGVQMQYPYSIVPMVQNLSVLPQRIPTGMQASSSLLRTALFPDITAEDLICSIALVDLETLIFVCPS